MSDTENRCEETRAGYSTGYVIRGTASYVDAQCARILANYHPCGYGTAITRRETLADGTSLAHITRANSCD